MSLAIGNSILRSAIGSEGVLAQRPRPVARGEIVGGRARMILRRLWRLQNKKEKARHLLCEIYDWFTEGFDTKDS